MKKHSGKVIYFGMMTALFGLLVMGAVSAATGIVAGAPGGAVADMAEAAGTLSFGLLAAGAVCVAAGLFMHGGSD